jgi:hypothetical protein
LAWGSFTSPINMSFVLGGAGTLLGAGGLIVSGFGPNGAGQLGSRLVMTAIQLMLGLLGLASYC